MALKGIPISEETKKKISDAHKGRVISLETRQKISKTLKGVPMSEETKRKISRALAGRKKTKEHISRVVLSRTGLKHSEESKKRMSIARFGRFRGSNSSQWRGGITPETRSQRNSFEYKFWRKSCFERDNFTCQKTGEYGGILVVHHINNFADFPELRFVISNGITLTKKAHDSFHKKYGKRNNTLEQLLLFLGDDSYGKKG